MSAISCKAPVSASPNAAGITFCPNLYMPDFPIAEVILLSIKLMTAFLNICGVAPFGKELSALAVIEDIICVPEVPFNKFLKPIVSNIPEVIAKGKTIPFFSVSETHSNSGFISICSFNLSA